MAKYHYQARNKQGKLENGIMSAYDEDDLYQRLKKEELFLIEAVSDIDARKIHQLPAQSLSEFNRELGDMLSAGVTLVKALTILAQEETRKQRERAVLLQILKLVRQGVSISDALEQQGGAFPILMVNMYRAAETNGKLADTAKRLAIHYEKEHQLGAKIKGATVYPKILSGLILLVIIFIISFILPQLSDLFDTLTELPLPTRILFGIGNFMQTYWKESLIVILLLIIVLFAMGRMAAMHMWKDKAKLHIPVVGKLFMVVYTARFARSLSSLYSAGIPIISAMQIARKTVGNKYIEKQFDEAISLLRAGKPLSESLECIYGFKKKLSSVIRVGEESGNLVQMLDALADSFDYESEMALNRLVSYVEPALILIMAFVIGFIMLAVMMPIYNSYSSIGSAAYY